MFHIPSWSSHRSRRSAKSTPAAEILAANEAIDKVVLFKQVLIVLCQDKAQSMVIFDSNELFHALLPERNMINKFVRSDVNSMHFYLETVIDVYAWIAGASNPADVGTKLSSVPIEALILTPVTVYQ